MPARVARERERFTAYRDRTQGRNLLADLLQEEVKRRERVVAVDAEAVALCPFASAVPFHVQLRAARGRRRGSRTTAPLGADILHEVLRAPGLRAGRAAPLNLWVRTAPRAPSTSAGGST